MLATVDIFDCAMIALVFIALFGQRFRALRRTPPRAAFPPASRFQFRLRTLMIVVTLLAIPCGYVGWQAKIVRERKAVLAEIEDAGGGFFSGLRTTTGFWNRFPNWPDEAIASIDSHRQLRAPATTIVRTLLGDESVIVIWLPATVVPATEARIRQSIPEAYVWRF